MELVYVTVIGAAIGALARYLLPGRRSYGALLLPALGAAVTSAVWAILVWVGWKFDGGWIWVVSLGAAVIVSIVTVLMIVRRRRHGDRRRLHQLTGGKA